MPSSTPVSVFQTAELLAKGRFDSGLCVRYCTWDKMKGILNSSTTDTLEAINKRKCEELFQIVKLLTKSNLIMNTNVGSLIKFCMGHIIAIVLFQEKLKII